MYYVYILINRKGELYKGISNNPKRRLKEHNSNQCPGSRGKGPWKLIYFEKCQSRKQARIREKYFKSGIGREHLNKLITDPR